MNTKQRITLALGFIVVAGLGAYVPWDMEVELGTLRSDQWTSITERQGYSFVWNVPHSRTEVEPQTTVQQRVRANSGNSHYERYTVSMNYEKILLSWVVAASVTAAVVLLLGLVQSPRTETPDSADNDKMDETS